MLIYKGCEKGWGAFLVIFVRRVGGFFTDFLKVGRFFTDFLRNQRPS